MSDAGLTAAEQIIARLLKKIGQGEAVFNPSGFVMKAAQNARQKLD